MAISMFDIEQVNHFMLFYRNLQFFFILFPFQQTVNHFEILVFLFDSSCLISALLWPAFFCSFANLVTDKIGEIGDAAYDTNWYYFSPEQKKFISLVIIRAQDPVYFTGLGLVNCTLEVFGDVSYFHQKTQFISIQLICSNIFLQLLKSSCSYYMGYRALGKR